jgi:hypothetical protein
VRAAQEAEQVRGGAEKLAVAAMHAGSSLDSTFAIYGKKDASPLAINSATD